jgi:hypothetical protein
MRQDVGKGFNFPHIYLRLADSLKYHLITMPSMVTRPLLIVKAASPLAEALIIVSGMIE